MTAAERRFTMDHGARVESLGFGSGDSAAVEARLHFADFNGEQGCYELRDAAGGTVLAGDIRAALEAIPCFTASTLVATGQGPCAIGDLTPGARVITRDNGMQELRWIGRRSFDWRALGLNPLLRPVRIAAGALGAGVPERDMVVSPNHRFLCKLPGQGESGERLCMARDMIGLDGVRSDTCTQVEYWQILFEQHELVLSDSCWSESFQPTAHHISALDEAGRAGLWAAVPEITATGAEVEIGAVRPELSLRSTA